MGYLYMVRKSNKVTKPKTYKYDVQALFDAGKLMSQEFYDGAMYLIKRFLTYHLIKKGYYKNGIKQTNLDSEDYEDCYTYIMTKIHEKYKPEEGKIATFIRIWIQGYCTVTVQKQARKYNKIGHELSLDIDKDLGISEEFRDSFSYQDIEDGLDAECFGNSYIDTITSKDIEEFRKKLNEYNKDFQF